MKNTKIIKKCIYNFMINTIPMKNFMTYVLIWYKNLMQKNVNINV